MNKLPPPRVDVSSTERQSNFELLRILAMLMIVAHHFAIHSGLPIWSGSGGNVFFAQFLCMQGKVGVDLFVLITGYFLVAKPGRVTSVVKLILETSLYGAALYLLFVAAGTEPFDWIQFVKSPQKYWFINCYIALFVISPFLGRMLQALTEEQYRWLLIVSVLYTGASFLPVLPGASYYRWPFVTFVVLFAIGGYFRRFGVADRWGWRAPVGITAASAVFLLCFAGFMDFIGRPKLFFAFSGMDMPPTIAISVGIFWLFAKLSIGNSLIINRIAACTLGVYLIHEHACVRPWLWHEAIHVAKHVTSEGFIPWSITIILLVFTICTAAEYARQRVMAPVVKRLLKPLKTLDEAVKKRF